MSDKRNGSATIEIRNATTDDIAGIAALVDECGPYLSKHIPYIYLIYTRCFGDTCSVALMDGRIVGWCSTLRVYICLPLNLLDVCDKYFRLILETALTDLLDEGRKGGSQVLAIVDEMAQLGSHMKALENAMGMAAGAAGLQLWCVLQDLSQLKGMFPQTWETFIQNMGATLWFGARDETTREYVSKLSGTTEVISRSRNVSFDHRGRPVVSEGMNQQGRPLLLPHEVGQLEADEMIAFIEGVRCGPIRARRKFYFKVFAGGYRKNPYVQSKSLMDWLFG